jgi:hypothetical protein
MISLDRKKTDTNSRISFLIASTNINVLDSLSLPQNSTPWVSRRLFFHNLRTASVYINYALKAVNYAQKKRSTAKQRKDNIKAFPKQ